MPFHLAKVLLEFCTDVALKDCSGHTFYKRSLHIILIGYCFLLAYFFYFVTFDCRVAGLLLKRMR